MKGPLHQSIQLGCAALNRLCYRPPMPSVSPAVPQTALTIAGFDPSSGAGITADLIVFAAHGLFGTSCITSLTVQSTFGVVDSFPVAASTVAATLDCLQADLPPAGIKIGMLANARIVTTVANYVEHLRDEGFRGPIVLDPVVRSSSGRELLDPAGLRLLTERLLPLVDWVTPNLAELELLTHLPATTPAELQIAATKLQSLGGKLNLLATAGHLNPPDDFLLTATGVSHWLPGVHIETSSTHGTGCALSSALLSRLIYGDQPYAACLAAKAYVTDALRTARPIGHGHGPLNLLLK